MREKWRVVFTKVSEEEIEEAFFHPSDLVNTKTTIPLRVGEERWIYIHHYSPPLRGIVIYFHESQKILKWQLCNCEMKRRDL